VSWWNLTNVHSYGGWQYTDIATTAGDCLDLCSRRSSCVAVDVNYNFLPVRCWVHDEWWRLHHSLPYYNFIQYRVVSRNCYDVNCTYVYYFDLGSHRLFC